MIASQTVYLTADRKRAVAEGDKSAQYLLVRKGQEIQAPEAEKYEGAIEMIGGTKKAEVPHSTNPPPTGTSPTGAPIESRDPEPAHRDPKHKRH